MKLAEAFTAFIDDTSECSRGLLVLLDSSIRLELLAVPPDTAVPTKRLTMKRLRKAQRLREAVKKGAEDRSTERRWPPISLARTVEYLRSCEADVPATVRERCRPRATEPEPAAAPAKPSAKVPPGKKNDAPPPVAAEESGFQLLPQRWVDAVEVSSAVRARVSSAHRAVVKERDEAVAAYAACLTQLAEELKAKCDRLLSQEQSWINRWRAQVAMLRQGNL